MPELHGAQLPIDGLHVAIRYDVADQAERDALMLVPTDVGAFLLQRDVLSIFALVSVTPVTWTQFADGATTLAAILAINAEVLDLQAASFVTASAEPTLTNALVLTQGTGIGITLGPGTVTIENTAAGASAVQGPLGATDTAIALFDGSTGTLIKESLARVDNLGNITTGGTVDGVDISNLALALALVAVPDYVTLSSTPTLGNERTLTAGAGITITDDGPGGAVTIESTVVGGGGAPTDAEYLVAATHAGLSAERVLTQGTGVTLTPSAGVLTIATPNAVQGPALATDGSIARYSGTTGKLLKNSTASLDDSGTLATQGLNISGNVSVGGNITVTGTVDGVDVSALANTVSTKADFALTDNPQAGSYTLTVAAPTQLTRMTSASANVLTVPPDASVLVALRAPVPILRTSTGITTITAGAGVTLRPANNLRLATQWDLATLMRIGANEWLVKGDVVV